MNQKDADAARPAFPVSETATHCGISMRDFFAAQALIGIVLADTVGRALARDGAALPIQVSDGISARAFLYADAMLAERAK